MGTLVPSVEAHAYLEELVDVAIEYGYSIDINPNLGFVSLWTFKEDKEAILVTQGYWEEGLGGATAILRCIQQARLYASLHVKE